MYRVLIVDDDRLVRQGIISMMPWEKYGMVIAGEAQNGERALEVLKQTAVDILFVDLDMPVMDGISLMEKSRELNPELLFVVLTFHEDFHYVQSALRIGAIDYISKLEMETTDCDELLKGISQKIERIIKYKNIVDEPKRDYGNANKAASEEHVFDQKEWNYIVKKWNEMYWIYDDVTFEALCESTKKIDISSWRVAQLLIQLTSEAEKSICKVERDIPEYENINDFIEWLIAFRKALYKRVSEETNLDKIQLCIMKAVLYVKGHLEMQLNVEEVTQIVNLSRSYFSINFKKYTGMSFKEFVRQERIRAAQALLVEKNDLVADIARDIGYEDVNYFIRVFCDLVGVTPGEYRKKQIRKYN